MKHEWVSVGTRRYCVKCGQDFSSASDSCGEKGNTKPKRKVAENAKKQAKTEVTENDEV